MSKDEFYLGFEWEFRTGRTGAAVYFDLDEIPHMTLMTGRGMTAIGA
jgi:hypothetical protein